MALAPTPTPTPEEEKFEGGLETFELELKNLRIKAQKTGPVLINRRSGETITELSWREWRLIKSFLDTLYSEYRALARGAR